MLISKPKFTSSFFIIFPGSIGIAILILSKNWVISYFGKLSKVTINLPGLKENE